MDCNNDCLFCSIPKKSMYLSYDEIITKIDKYKKGKYDQITITGGEPTLHKNVLEIITYAKSKNLAVRLVTNGVNLNEQFIDKLFNSHLNYLTISVHTLDENKAKLISNNKNYDLNSILNNIKYAVNLGLRVYFNFTVNNLNYKELPSLARYLVKEIPNIHMVNFNYVDLWGNTVENEHLDLRYYLAEKYLVEAFKTLVKNKIEFRAERIPLCYLVGFEKYSSDFNRIVSLEKPKTDFLEKNVVEITPKDYLKGDCCIYCSYSKYCYGVSEHYVKKYGFGEFYPIFHKLQLDTIKNDLNDSELK